MDWTLIIVFILGLLFAMGLPMLLVIRRVTKPERDARRFVRDVNKRRDSAYDWIGDRGTPRKPERKHDG